MIEEGRQKLEKVLPANVDKENEMRNRESLKITITRSPSGVTRVMLVVVSESICQISQQGEGGGGTI